VFVPGSLSKVKLEPIVVKHLLGAPL